MIEMFKQFGVSIWLWFIENKDTITAFFMSGQAASFIAALVMLVKNVKSTKDNTESTRKLDETLLSTNCMHASVNNLDVNFSLLKQENDSLRTELKQTEEKLQIANTEIISKLNAIIEVQSIVYSTIRDDSVRQTVNTILNNARYSEKNFKESLETQIEELKNTYQSELQALNDKVSTSMEQVKDSLNAGKTAEQIMRNRNENTIRY